MNRDASKIAPPGYFDMKPVPATEYYEYDVIKTDKIEILIKKINEAILNEWHVDGKIVAGVYCSNLYYIQRLKRLKA